MKKLYTFLPVKKTNKNFSTFLGKTIDGLFGKKIDNNLRIRMMAKTAEILAAKLPTAVGGGSSATYVEDMYRAWLTDPTCVHTSWDAYFRTGVYEPVPSDQYPQRNLMPLSQYCGCGNSMIDKAVNDNQRIHDLIRGYQTRGFLAANLDPLGIANSPKTLTVGGMQLNANANVFMYADLFKEEINLDQTFKLSGSTTCICADKIELSLREIIQRMEKIYCDTMGLEYMYIFCPHRRAWIRKRVEVPGATDFTSDKKRLILKRLIRATSLESFLAKKWPSEKRFGLEGCEVLIPCLKEIIDRSSALGVESFIIGLAHRGRLNTLANICRRPLHQIFAQFRPLETDMGSGDVKYHLGTYMERLNRATNKNIRIALVANPSHLEAVNPVVMGKTRAEQFYKGDSEGKKIMCILIHGDAAFPGQGVVYESIHLSDLPDYTVHGTVHVIINNQIGFTTDPRFNRSSPFCSDLARVVNAPILHVNADDPEGSVFLSGVAAEWRSHWRTDIVLDLVGYRRNGHNEADEPMFTQPLMYQNIRKHRPVLDLYAEKLINENIITEEEYKAEVESYEAILNQGFEDSAKEQSISYKDWIDSPWSGFFEGKDPMELAPTGVKEETLLHIATKFSSPPPPEAQFHMHKGIERIFNFRQQMVEDRLADWALGEALAYGSLLKEGVHVRLSGEDVERGTFSHRHHVLSHQSIDKVTYNMLGSLYPDQAQYTVCNSSLSEYAVLGFEHGFSMANPNALVMWEAQFGDFCNTGQAMFDQFISSGEMKWMRQSGLVMLLPHGMEGMGPEHSSGRPERFLQMCDDDPDNLPFDCENVAMKQLKDTNWIVANCTTPANLFHILRRQIALPFRKPLVLFTPKSGLRHPLARSPFSDMTECTEFKRIIPDYGPACESPECVTKIIFCCGKVYFDLFKARADRKAEKTICLIRVEQICPFPYDLVRDEICYYKNADVLWAQEEHKNQGCWTYVQPRFHTALEKDEDLYIQYHGRPAAAAPSTGNKLQHERELKNFIVSIFGELTEAQKEVLRKEEEERIAQAKDAAEKAKEAAKPPEPNDTK